MSSGPRLHLQWSAAPRVEVLERAFGVAAQEHLTHAHALTDLELVGAGAYLEPQLVPGGGGQRGDDGRVRDAEPRRPLDQAGVDLVRRARLPQRRPRVQVRERFDVLSVGVIGSVEAPALLRAGFAVLVAETEGVAAFVGEQEDEPVEVGALLRQLDGDEVELPLGTVTRSLFRALALGEARHEEVVGCDAAPGRTGQDADQPAVFATGTPVVDADDRPVVPQPVEQHLDVVGGDPLGVEVEDPGGLARRGLGAWPRADGEGQRGVARVEEVAVGELAPSGERILDQLLGDVLAEAFSQSGQEGGDVRVGVAGRGKPDLVDELLQAPRAVVELRRLGFRDGEELARSGRSRSLT